MIDNKTKFKKILNISVSVLLVLFMVQFEITKIAKDRLFLNLIDTLHFANLRLDVSAFPALKMLWGHFDKISLSAMQAVFDEITVYDVSIDARNVDLPNTTANLENISLGRSKVGFSLRFDKVRELYISKIENLSGLYVYLNNNLNDNKVYIAGSVSLFGFDADVVAKGSLNVIEGNVLEYSVSSLKVENIDIPDIPDIFVENIKNLLNFKFEITQLPFGIILDSVSLNSNNNLIILKGHTNE